MKILDHLLNTPIVSLGEYNAINQSLIFYLFILKILKREKELEREGASNGGHDCHSFDVIMSLGAMPRSCKSPHATHYNMNSYVKDHIHIFPLSFFLSFDFFSLS